MAKGQMRSNKEAKKRKSSDKKSRPKYMAGSDLAKGSKPAPPLGRQLQCARQEAEELSVTPDVPFSRWSKGLSDRDNAVPHVPVFETWRHG